VRNAKSTKIMKIIFNGKHISIFTKDGRYLANLGK
jgi:hypothetical protein